MYDNWDELETAIIECKNCKLHNNRKNIVFGQGKNDARVMIIGEAPGTEEDSMGLPFLGKSGQLMDKALSGIGIDKDDVYFTNLVKCRPPSNRIPDEIECQTCLDILRNQVILIKPKIIVLLGGTVLKNILGKEFGIINARGTWVEKKGIFYMPTWHPLDLLRDESKKIQFWADLKKVKDKML